MRDAMLKGSESGPVVVPGKPEESPLITAIRYGGEVQMPPKGKLKDAEIAALTDWVKQGAPWPEARPGISPRKVTSTDSTAGVAAPMVALSSEGRTLWSLQPVQNPAPPPVQNKDWPASPIDRFVLAKLEQNGLGPAPVADKRILIRRATFDLIGLPPTPEEIDAFVRDDAPTPSPMLSTGCWPRPTLASDGVDTGSTWRATVKTRPTRSSPGFTLADTVIATG